MKDKFLKKSSYLKGLLSLVASGLFISLLSVSLENIIFDAAIPAGIILGVLIGFAFGFRSGSKLVRVEYDKVFTIPGLEGVVNDD